MKSGELYQDNIQNNKCCAICGVEHIAGEKLWMSVVELSTDDLIMNMLFVFCNSCVPFACIKQPIVCNHNECSECPEARALGARCRCGLPHASDWQCREKRV